MPKRKRDPYASDYSESPEPDSDEEYTPAKKSPKKSAAKKPSTKAKVTIRATDAPLDRLDSKKRLEKVDSAVIGRIKKALALAQHAQTGEAEARAALRMASKLLEQHNVTQADIMSQETESEQLKRAGTSIVSVKSTLPNATVVKLERWSGALATAMEIYFDCQHYTTTFTNKYPPKVDWSFYGLAESTVTAALAFETTYNLVMEWSLKPNVGKGVHAKNCYRNGVASGLIEMAKKEKEDDRARAEKKERALLKARQEEEAAEDKSRLARLEGPEDKKIKTEEVEVDVKPEPDHRVKMEEVDDGDDFGAQSASDDGDSQMGEDDDSDGEGMTFADSDEMQPDFDDADDVNDLLDLDAEKPVLKRSDSMGPPPLPKVKSEPNEDESPWSSVGQLVAFRESSIAIGDEYLKAQGIKLVKGRKSTLEFKDAEAARLYRQGKQDARKIDVRQRRLKAAEMDD